MSTVITDNLTGKTSAGDVTITSEGGAVTMQLQQGVAKAWASIDGDGSGTPVFDSFNTASITDSDTGIYILNFTNSMNNDDYTVSGGNSGNGGYACAYTTNQSSHTTSATGVKVLRTDNAARVDAGYANMIIHGDLA